MSKKPVSVIIVNYNGSDVILKCLKSVFNQSYPKYEVFVVDNASADGSADAVKSLFDKVKLITNPVNLGFAKACNQGAEAASGDHIIFLNYDTVVDKDWLDNLVKAAEADDGVGVCMSKLLVYKTDPPVINSFGGMIHYLGLSWSGGYKQKDDGRYNSVREVAFASGAAMLIKRNIWAEVGNFNEDYFMYLEDTDFSWRVRLAGYKVIFVPDSIVWHRYHFSKGKNKFYLLERNRLMMILSNYRASTLALLLIPSLFFESAMMVNALFGGWGLLKLRGYKEVFQNRDIIKKRRRKINYSRRCSDRQITGLFTDTIDFPDINNFFVSMINIFFRIYWKLVYPLIR